MDRRQFLFGGVAAGLVPNSKMQYFDAKGHPLAGGKLWSYAAGTNTPLVTYTDSTGKTPNPNPVILNARGEANVWLGSASYKLVLKDSANATIWALDNVTGADGNVLASLAASGGASLVGYQPAGAGAVATTVQAKLRESVSVRDFGAAGDGVKDDSAAIAAAIRHATTPIVDGSVVRTRHLEWPEGRYLITQNNWIGANLPDNAFGGRLDTIFSGIGRNSSKILFRPTVAEAACYDQTLTPNNLLNGFTFERLGVEFDNSHNGRKPIHFIKSVAAPKKASQNFRLNNCKFSGVPGSVLFTLGGAVNEDMISGYDLLIADYQSVVVSLANLEALIHEFYHLDLLGITGHAFNYSKGGSLAVYGCNAIMTGTAGMDTAILYIGGGTTTQTYYLNNVRSELRGANTRALMMVASENSITFESCNLSSNIPGKQAWAIVPVQHHSCITFRDCILPTRKTGTYGALQLVDSLSGYDYSTNSHAASMINFINCQQQGDRRYDMTEGWVDYSQLTAPYANYRTLVVSYRGCHGLPDSVEYGGVFRQGRTFNQYAPQKLIFRGTSFPYGNGISAAVASAADLNLVVPLNNFLTEIVVMRKAVGGAAMSYQIEFIDQAERDSPGTGVIFGYTTAKPNNQAIFERVPLLRQFTGTKAQRTIWCRMRAGFSLVSGSTGTLLDGGIYAEVL